MRYKLIIIWETEEKEVHTYENREKAEEIMKGYKKVFGDQIQWMGIYNM